MFFEKITMRFRKYHSSALPVSFSVFIRASYYRYLSAHEVGSYFRFRAKYSIQSQKHEWER